MGGLFLHCYGLGEASRQTCSPVDNMRIFQPHDKFPITAGLEHDFQQLDCFTFGYSSISPFDIIAPRLYVEDKYFQNELLSVLNFRLLFSEDTHCCFQEARSPLIYFFQAGNPKPEITFGRCSWNLNTGVSSASYYILGEVLFCMQILISVRISLLLLRSALFSKAKKLAFHSCKGSDKRRKTQPVYISN